MTMFDKTILAAENVNLHKIGGPNDEMRVTLVVTGRFEKLLAIFHGKREVWCAKYARKA
jgi:hypothetical protein